MKYCPQCGIPAQDNHLFCISCGAKFPEYTVHNTSANTQSGNSNTDGFTSNSAKEAQAQSAPSEPFVDIPLEAPKYKLNYWLLWGIVATATALLITIAIML